uniref:Ubiquitin-like domain-containing protein n=1 Tax=Caenorhabditis japonica TaxID=281687 RepID=A0A8R1DYY1_CAEJA
TLLDEIPVTVSVLDCEVTKEIKRHELQSTSTFEEIRRQYANLWKCGLASVIITHKGETVPKDCTPKDLGFRPMQIPNPKLEIYRKSDTENGGGLNGGIITVESTPDYFIVKAQFKNRKKPVLIKVQDETTVGKIKELILEQLEEEKEPEIPRIEAMRVIFDDEYLTDDSATCQDIGIENEDCLDIHVQ